MFSQGVFAAVKALSSGVLLAFVFFFCQSQGSQAWGRPAAPGGFLPGSGRFWQRSRGYSGLSFDKTWDARHRVLCLLPVFQGHLPLEITMRDIGVALVSTRAATYVDDTAMNQEVQW